MTPPFSWLSPRTAFPARRHFPEGGRRTGRGYLASGRGARPDRFRLGGAGTRRNGRHRTRGRDQGPQDFAA